ncbi:MAG TPA: PsbP-related protein [Spirochaetota bacterium]
MNGVFCVCVGLLVLTGCNRDYARYVDRDNGFSVEYPRGWQIKHVDQEGVAINFESPTEKPGDTFSENFSVTAGEYDREIDPQTFANLSLGVTKSYISKFSIREQLPYKNGKIKGFSVLYEGKGFAGENLVFRQVFFVKGKSLFSIIFTMEQDKLSQYLPVAHHVIDSFRFE